MKNMHLSIFYYNNRKNNVLTISLFLLYCLCVSVSITEAAVRAFALAPIFLIGWLYDVLLVSALLGTVHGFCGLCLFFVFCFYECSLLCTASHDFEKVYIWLSSDSMFFIDKHIFFLSSLILCFSCQWEKITQVFSQNKIKTLKYKLEYDIKY